MVKEDKQIAAAQTRIRQKLDILQMWAEKGIPEKHSAEGHKQVDSKGLIILEFFPQSTRAFRYWTGKDCSPEVRTAYQLDKLKTISNDAWKRAPLSVRERWEGTEQNNGLIYQLKARAKMQTDDSNSSRLQKLEAELALVRLNHKGVSHELVQLRLDNIDLAAELSSERSQHESTKFQSKNEIEWRNNQNNLLKEKLRILHGKYNQLSERYLKLAKHTGESDPKLPLTDSNIIDFPEKEQDD